MVAPLAADCQGGRTVGDRWASLQAGGSGVRGCALGGGL